MRLRRLLLNAISGALLLSALSCGFPSPRVLSPHIDPKLFQSKKSISVCFDLSDQGSVVGGLRVTRTATSVTQRTIILPFDVRNATPNTDVWMTYSSNTGVTLMNYVASPDTGATQSFTFLPVVHDINNAGDDAFQRLNFDSPLTFIHGGLKHRLVFQPSLSTRLEDFLLLQSLPHESIEEVLVRLPSEATPIMSPQATAPPSRSDRLHGALVTAFDMVGASLLPIDVTYQIPPNASQKKTYEFLLKLFALIGVPLVALFVGGAALAAPTRKRLLWGGVVLEVILAALLVLWTFHAAPVEGYGNLYDIGLAVVGIACSILVAKLKS